MKPPFAKSPWARFPLLGIPLLLALLPSGEVRGQSVEEALTALALDNARLYLDPFTRGLGFAMNSGAFDRAAPMGLLGFDVGIRVMGAGVPADALDFQAVLPASVTYAHPVLGPQTYQNPYRAKGGSLTTPTVFGTARPIVLEPTGQFRQDLILAGENPSDFELPFPEGLVSMPAVPFAILSASLGVGIGTEISALFIPEVNIRDELGSLRAEGFGVSHAISHWFTSPVDLSVGYQWQSVRVGEYLDASASRFALMAGVGFGPLSLVGSGALRSSDVEIRYTVQNPGNQPGLPDDGTVLSYSSEVTPGAVLGAGVRLQLLFMNLAAQYTMDEYNTFSLKIGLGIP